MIIWWYGLLFEPPCICFRTAVLACV